MKCEIELKENTKKNSVHEVLEIWMLEIANKSCTANTWWNNASQYC